LLIKDIGISKTDGLVIDKGKFIFEHQSDNIRDDYLIGKVLGSGKLPFHSFNLSFE